MDSSTWIQVYERKQNLNEKSKHRSRFFIIRAHVVKGSLQILFEADLSVVVSIDRGEGCLCEVWIDKAEIVVDSAILVVIEVAILI